MLVEPQADVEDVQTASAADEMQDMPPPWDDLPPDAVDAEPVYGGQEPPVWEDIPDDAASSAKQEAQPPVAAVQESAEELERTPLGDAWHAVVTQLDAAQAITALVRELALQSQLVAQDGGVWSLRVQRTSLNQATTRERLLKALTSITDCTSLQVENGPVTDTPALRNKAQAQARQKQAEAVVMDDPRVQRWQQTLGATIVPGSIRPL